MKTNKKLNLTTKKVIILSNEQQASVQGGRGDKTSIQTCRTTCLINSIGTVMM